MTGHAARSGSQPAGACRRSPSTPPWEEARDYDALPLEAIECLFDSASIAVSDTVAGYAHPSFPPGRPLLEAVADLDRAHSRGLHVRSGGDHRRHAAAATCCRCGAASARTSRGWRSPACARSGWPARYVSGYLETVPPPGKPRLAGADASHAWLAVYCPGLGWVDVDPTNNMFPSTTHVTLAWGRDYGDVSPVRGVILGGGQHSLRVSVDVLRA